MTDIQEFIVSILFSMLYKIMQGISNKAEVDIMRNNPIIYQLFLYWQMLFKDKWKQHMTLFIGMN